MKLISKFLDEVDTGDNIIYRGHADSKWILMPSIGRHYSGDWGEVSGKEINALEEFKKRAIPHLKYQPKADIEWLCLMQHHGLSTRLLDFTTNPLIALFFASDPAIRKNGELIIAKYGRSYENVSDEKLFNRTHSFAYHPPHITERIIGQHGCFVYANTPNKPLNNKQISKISVAKKDKYVIREELKTLGINHSVLFPGIDGVCKDINEELVWDLSWEDVPF